MLFKPFCALSIAFTLLIMHQSIDFYDQSPLSAIKVHDERTKCELSAPFEARPSTT
jgi:hypothetical protein